MARSTQMSDEDDLYGASPPPSGQGQQMHAAASQNSLSPSPATSSDKENRSRVDKGKGRASMGPPRAPSPDRAQKRKRASTREVSVQRGGSVRRSTEVEEEYDPDQSIEERRRIRLGFRELGKTLLDNRAEYSNPESTGLKETLLRANALSEQVKQTSDATIDSRLLVNATDLVYKKTVRLTSGDTAQGVDLSDFMSKCLSYMRRGPGASASTQRRRAREDDEEEDGNGDMLDWEFLGRSACLPNISRPSLPAFLLGPLSLQKRARKPVARRAALRPNKLTATRPEVLQTQDIEKSENANLTTLCTQILTRLKKVSNDLRAAAEADYDYEMTSEEEQKLFDRHGISQTGGIALFKFVVNPWSFGQTVENLFYVSFLIREGKVGISTDKYGVPFLEIIQANDSSSRGRNVSKHQAIIALDMAQWKEIIELWDIKQPMILHRQEVERSEGARGWYA